MWMFWRISLSGKRKRSIRHLVTVTMQLVDIHQRRLSEFHGGETLLNKYSTVRHNTVYTQHTTRKYKHFKILHYTRMPKKTMQPYSALAYCLVLRYRIYNKFIIKQLLPSKNLMVPWKQYLTSCTCQNSSHLSFRFVLILWLENVWSNVGKFSSLVSYRLGRFLVAELQIVPRFPASIWFLQTFSILWHLWCLLLQKC